MSDINLKPVHSFKEILKFSFIYVFRQPLFITGFMIYMFLVSFLMSKTFLLYHFLLIILMKEPVEYLITLYISKTYSNQDLKTDYKDEIKKIKISFITGFMFWGFYLLTSLVINYSFLLSLKLNGYFNFYLLIFYLLTAIFSLLHWSFNRKLYFFDNFLFVKESIVFSKNGEIGNVSKLSNLITSNNMFPFMPFVIVSFMIQFLIYVFLFVGNFDSLKSTLLIIVSNFIYFFFCIVRTIYFLDIMGFTMKKEKQESKDLKFNLENSLNNT